MNTVGNCTWVKSVVIFSILLVQGLGPTFLWAEDVGLPAVRDTTIYEDSGGALSSGMGDYMFVGINGANGGSRIMRSLVVFDISAIPQGAVIESAELRLYQSTPQGDETGRTVSVHRLLKDWGEGESDADGDTGAGSGGADGAAATEGDSTWLHTFYDDTFWTSAGGDYTQTASAARDVGGNGYYQWNSTPGLVADVQSWVDDPTSNFGWVLKGEEALNGASNTAKRFSTRHVSAGDRTPQLVVRYNVYTGPAFVFPQFVAGGGNSTRWILRNNSDSVAEGHIAFLDATGESNAVSVNGGFSDRIDFSLDPWGSMSVSTDSTGRLETGAAHVITGGESAAKLEAAEVFSLLGRYVSVTGAKPGKQWQTYVSRNAAEGSGVAIQNPSREQAAVLTMTLVDAAGTVVANETLTILRGRRIAQFVGEQLIFKDYFEQNPGDFEGTLNIRVTEGGPIAVVGLIQKKADGALIAVEATKTSFVGAN